MLHAWIRKPYFCFLMLKNRLPLSYRAYILHRIVEKDYATEVEKKTRQTIRRHSCNRQKQPVLFKVTLSIPGNQIFGHKY